MQIKLLSCITGESFTKLLISREIKHDTIKHKYNKFVFYQHWHITHHFISLSCADFSALLTVCPPSKNAKIFHSLYQGLFLSFQTRFLRRSFFTVVVVASLILLVERSSALEGMKGRINLKFFGRKLLLIINCFSYLYRFFVDVLRLT